MKAVSKASAARPGRDNGFLRWVERTDSPELKAIASLAVQRGIRPATIASRLNVQTTNLRNDWDRNWALTVPKVCQALGLPDVVIRALCNQMTDDDLQRAKLALADELLSLRFEHFLEQRQLPSWSFETISAEHERALLREVILAWHGIT